jgi:hypothetical protein
MVAGSVIMAINFLSAPQWGQSKTSSSKALRINSAHDRHLAGGFFLFWEWRKQNRAGVHPGGKGNPL